MEKDISEMVIAIPIFNEFCIVVVTYLILHFSLTSDELTARQWRIGMVTFLCLVGFGCANSDIIAALGLEHGSVNILSEAFFDNFW